MIRHRVVFDASVVVRAVVSKAPTALDWIHQAEAHEIDAVVPELLYAECANAILRYARGGAFDSRSALERVDVVKALPLDARPLAPLIAPALALSYERELSVYDGCYLALSEAERATLVTADRRLAAAAENVLLIP